MNGKKILVIGSLNMDLTVYMEKIPTLGETVIGETIITVPGGKGANQACAIGKLCGNVGMLGCVGDDAFSDKLLKSLQSANVDTVPISKMKDTPSGTATIWVQNNDGGNSIVVIPGANNKCDLAYIKRNLKAIEESEFIVLQLEIPLESVYYAIDTAHALGKTIILNPAPMPETLSLEHLRMADYITPNETELIQLFCMVLPNTPLPEPDDIPYIADTLARELGATLIVTMGKQGALLADGRTISEFPAIPCVAVDTTAAGDCFTGAFAVKLSEGSDIEAAITFASLAAGVSVTRQGAQIALPTREEVNNIQNIK